MSDDTPGVVVPNDAVAGLGYEHDPGGVIPGPWFYPVCQRCFEQWGPSAWRHVPDNLLAHFEETGHDDWDIWIFWNLPTNYDLKTLDEQFFHEVFRNPLRVKYGNAPRCRECYRIIRLPKDWGEPPDMAGMPDLAAQEGDLCDRCGKIEMDAAWLEHEWRQDRALDEKLRERSGRGRQI